MNTLPVEMATARRRPVDTLGWVTNAMRAERLAFSEEMERRHDEMLSELRKVLDSAAGQQAAPAPPGNGDGKPPSAKPSPLEEPVKPTAKEGSETGNSDTYRDSELEEADAEANVNDFDLALKTHGAGSLMDDLDDTDTNFCRGTSAKGSKKRHRKLRTETQDEVKTVTVLDKVSAGVSSVYFEMTFALLIVLNTVMMAVEAQYNGLESCYIVRYAGCTRPASQIWPGVALVFAALENVFGVAFTVEVVAKLLGHRRRFFLTWWNWFDSLIIIAWLIDVLGNGFPMNPMILRLVRMFRLLRLVRLLRTSTIFETLHLMIAALKSSLTVALWMAVFLGLIMLTCTLVLTSFLNTYYHDESQPEDQRQEVYKYFGTFSRGFLSMFELTLGNWVVITRVLHEHVSEWFGPLVLVYRTIVGEALIKVVTGVFMYETFRCAGADDEMMIMDKSRAIRRHTTKMQMLFEEADDSGDGYLDCKEFTEACTDPRIRAWLAAMDIPVHAASEMFALLDNSHDQRLSHEELATGLARLKGPARAFEMALLMNKISSDFDNLKGKLAHLSNIDESTKDMQPFVKQLSQLSTLELVQLDELETQARDMMAALEETRAARAVPPQPPMTPNTTSMLLSKEGNDRSKESNDDRIKDRM